MKEPNDNFEKYFRQQLNKKVDPEPWNTPDDAVWENIASAIKNQTPERKLWLWIFPLGFAMLAGITFTFNEIKSKDHTIKNLRLQIENCQQSLHNMPAEIIQERTFLPPQQNEHILNSGDHAAISGRNFKTGIIKRKALSENILHNSATEWSDNDNGANKEGHVTTIVDSADMKVYDYEEYELIATKEVDDIPILMAGFFADNLEKETDNATAVVSNEEILLPVNSPSASVHKKGLSIGIHSGVGNFIQRISGINSPDLISGKEYFDKSIYTGISVRKKITGSLSLETGLNYISRNYNSAFLLNIPYQHHNENPANDGSIDYHLNHNLNSGLGAISVEMWMNRASNTQVNPGEIVEMEFTAQSSVKMMEIPLNLLWKPLKKSGLYISSGLNAQFVLDRNIEVAKYLSHHNVVHEKHAETKYIEDNYTNFTITGILGAGYDLKVGQNWTVSVGANYQRAINPAYKSTGKELFVDQISSGIKFLRSL